MLYSVVESFASSAALSLLHGDASNIIAALASHTSLNIPISAISLSVCANWE